MSECEWKIVEHARWFSLWKEKFTRSADIYIYIYIYLSIFWRREILRNPSLTAATFARFALKPCIHALFKEQHFVHVWFGIIIIIIIIIIFFLRISLSSAHVTQTPLSYASMYMGHPLKPSGPPFPL